MKTFLLLSTLSLILIGCNKDVEPEQVEPPCITEKVKYFSENAWCETGASVREYEFKGDLVYVFDHGICIADGASAVLDSNCDTIGSLGGFFGNTEVDGVSFDNNAELQRTLFSN